VSQSSFSGNSQLGRRSVLRRVVLVGVSIATLGGAATGIGAVAPSLIGATVSSRILVAPDSVRVGESFVIVGSGFVPGRNVEFLVGSSTMGWGLVGDDGVARAENAVWKPGVYTVSARLDGIGDAITRQITVGDGGVPSTSLVGIRTLAAPAAVRVGESFVITGTGFTPGRYVEFLVNSSTMGWGLVGDDGVARAENSFYEVGTFAVSARLDGTGDAITRQINVGDVGTPTSIRDSRTLAAPDVVRVGESFVLVGTGFTPGRYVEFLVGSSTMGWGLVGDDGVARAENAVWAEGVYTVSARLDGAGDAVTRQITVGSGGPATTVPSSSVPNSSVPDPSLPDSSVPQTTTQSSTIQSSTTPSTLVSTVPTSGPVTSQPVTIQPPTTRSPTTQGNAKISAMAQYDFRASSDPLLGYVRRIVPTAPNRIVDDLEVICGEGQRLSRDSFESPILCIGSLDESRLYSAEVRDRKGEYSPVTVQWWGDKWWVNDVFQPGQKAIVNFASRFGLNPAEISDLQVTGDVSCVEVVCTTNAVKYIEMLRSRVPGGRMIDRPDFSFSYSFSARGVEARGTIQGNMLRLPPVAPAQVRIGEPFEVTFQGLRPGASIAGFGIDSDRTLQEVEVDSQGVGRLKVVVNGGEVPRTIEFGSSFFPTRVAVAVVAGPPPSTTPIGRMAVSSFIGSPAPFATKTNVRNIVASAPNRVSNDFEVTCGQGQSIGQGWGSVLATCVAPETAATLYSAVVRDRNGQYPSVTVNWWGDRAWLSETFEPGQKVRVDFADRFGIPPSAISELQMQNATCVGAVCETSSPIYINLLRPAGKFGPFPDETFQYSFVAYGVEATGPLLINLRRPRLIAPSEVRVGETFEVTWSGRRPGSTLDIFGGDTNTSQTGTAMVGTDGVARMKVVVTGGSAPRTLTFGTGLIPLSTVSVKVVSAN
jgi:flavin-binding protein dodecin